MPTSNATATWEGAIKSGQGHFHGSSGKIDAPYTFAQRFEGAPGTNPEELLAAAEAACFSMALSGNLEKNGTPPQRIETAAACTVAPKQGGGFRITTMQLTVRVAAQGLDAAKLKEVAQMTKETCPVSLALASNVEISVEASLA